MNFLKRSSALMTASLSLVEAKEACESGCERSMRIHTEHALDYQYLRYVAHYGKDYKTLDEYEHRRENFVLTEHILAQLATQLHSQTVGHNKFSDWTEEELSKIRTLRASPTDIEHMRHRYAKLEADFIDKEINWIERGAVTAVRDGGHCGSSWAHAAVAVIEGAHYLESNQLMELSTQQLIDCDSYNYGCEGGFMASAFEYSEKNSLMLEQDYPWAGFTDRSCHLVAEEAIAHVTRYINVLPNDPDQLKIAVSMGPVVAAVASHNPAFQFYRRGVIHSESCGTDVDAAITIVGYGESHDYGQYWLVKNSWGTSWGEQGYGRIAISAGPGVCGINTQPSIAFAN